MDNPPPQDSSSKLGKLWRRYRNLPPNVLALSVVSLLNDASSEIIYPLLPFFLTLVLGASPFVIGSIEGAAESISSLLKLAAGYFSDKHSKRKATIFAGYGLSAVIRPFLGFATSWTGVFFLRITDRIGKGIRSAPRDALVADSTPPEKRGLAFGFHRAMDNAGAVVGPLLGFFLIEYFAADRAAPSKEEYTQVFLAASIPAILSLFVVGFFVRETKTAVQSEPPKESPKKKGQRIKDKKPKTPFDNNFRKFLFVLVLFTLSNSSDTFLLLRAREAGIEPVWIPLVWAFLNIVKVISSLVGGDLSDRIGRKTLIFSGWLLYGIVYAGFAFVTTPGAAIILFAFYGIYFGLTEGVEKALVTDLVPAERRGTAFGWYHLAFGIAVFPASLAMGAIWNYYGFQVAFLTSAAISIAAAFLLLTVQTKKSAPVV